LNHLLLDLASNIERQTEGMIEKDPINKNAFMSWKNQKLHQLMAAQTILSNQDIH